MAMTMIRLMTSNQFPIITTEETNISLEISLISALAGVAIQWSIVPFMYTIDSGASGQTITESSNAQIVPITFHPISGTSSNNLDVKLKIAIVH